MRLVLNIKRRKHAGVLCISNLSGYYKPGYFYEEKKRAGEMTEEFCGYVSCWVFYLDCTLE